MAGAAGGRPAPIPTSRRAQRLPRKPNYSFERRQRDLAKAAKKAARLEARTLRRERRAAERQASESDGEAGESR